jgi:SSS family solute:Na+ symporter
LFVIGGVYFLGPDIMSRNFISRDPHTAKRSARTAGIVLLVFSLMITLVGMWIRYNVTPEELGESGALLYAISMLPKAVGILLVFGLLSAILSSTDTCIINASTIFVKDILKKEQVAPVRIAVLIIGGLALLLAAQGRGDIMSLLTGAYSVYTPGVIFPLMIAVFACGKGGVRKGIWMAAVTAGGICGLAGTYFATPLTSAGIPAFVMNNLTLMGMGVSLLLSVLSVIFRKKEI